MEEMCREVWLEGVGVTLDPPFRRMTYADAMLRFGTEAGPAVRARDPGRDRRHA